MLVPMLTPVRGRRLPARTVLLAVAASMSEAAAAVHAGADLVDLVNPSDLGDPRELANPSDLGDPRELGWTDRSAVAEFRARHPCVLVCATDEAADLVCHPAMAIATGALLVCADPAAARASGLPAARVIVAVMPDGVAAAAEAGWAAMVDVDQAADLAAAHSRPAGPDRAAGRRDDDPAELAGIVAIAAISSWLGAAVVRTRYPLQVRRALDMTATIQGTRPPARTVRGLA